MAKGATTRSDVLEQEYDVGVSQLVRAGILLLASLLLLWAGNLTMQKSPPGTFGNVYLGPGFKVLSALSFLGFLAYAVLGGQRISKSRKVASVSVNCPYCDFPMQFPEQPTEDFTCEKCHRRVQYENGQMVPVRTVTCASCKSVHKVSAKATSYVCDRCNRALKLADANNPEDVVVEQSGILQNYDVILTQVGRNRNEVAMALESLLICNLVEARRQMENLPLTVVRNVAERKADAIRRRLLDLGASAVVRPTAEAEPPPRVGRV
jgi:ribosomal protein L7/L12